MHIICPSNSRKFFHVSLSAFYILMMTGLLATASAHAADDDRFTLSGYGYEDYRQSSANIYEGADKRGTWENGIFALIGSFSISDSDTAWAQLESEPSQPTEFIWAYLDHRFNDNLSAHIGRIKMPYGFYNEYIDNKALQLTAVRPSAYSFKADMVHDAYQGIGVDWTTGSLFTQIFGGKIYTPANNGAITDAFTGRDRRYIGTRFTWSAPVDGLRFMFSTWDGQVEDNTGITATPPLGTISKEYRTMLSVEYVTDRLDIKSERNHHQVPPTDAHPSQPIPNCSVGGVQCVTDPIAAGPGNTTNAWYVQAGYKMGLWTPYTRFDYFIGDNSNTSDPSSYQKNWVIGVNYKLTSNLNARIEEHFIRGYGLSVATQEMAAGAGQRDWNMMAAEVNFKF